MKATPAGSHVKRPTTFPRGLRVWRLSDGSGVRNNVTITRPRRHGQHRLLQQQCLKVCLEAVIPALTAAVGLRLSKNQKEMLGDRLLANPSAAGFWAAALRAKSTEMGWARSGTRRARVLPLRSKLQHEIFPLKTAAPQPPPAQPQLQPRAPEGPQAVGMGWPSAPKAFPQKKKKAPLLACRTWQLQQGCEPATCTPGSRGGGGEHAHPEARVRHRCPRKAVL